MSAIGDVARLAGVSKSTASRALSGSGYVAASTRQRVIDAAAELGYVLSTSAASLVTGRTRAVGVVVPRINRWFFGAVLEGVEAALGEAEHDLVLYRIGSEGDRRKRVFEYFLSRKRVDAVITIGVALSPAEVASLRAIGGPIVGVSGELEGMTTLSIDDHAAGRLITEHLLSLGHRRIVHLGDADDEQQGFRVHERRRDGVLEALREAGVDTAGVVHPTPYTVPDGYRSGLAVLADPRRRPTAIVAGCDEIAIGALVAARQLGIRVPSDLSVIGIDGHQDARMFGLTSLEQDPESQGRRAVELVLAALDSGAEPEVRHWESPVHFTVRTSTTAPAQHPLGNR